MIGDRTQDWFVANVRELRWQENELGATCEFDKYRERFDEGGVLIFETMSLSGVRRSLLAAAVAGLTLLASGCGGSKSPSVASLGTTGSTATSATVGASGTTANPNQAAFATCLSQHGFVAAVGSAGSAPNKSLSIAGVIVSGNVDPSSPQFQAAVQACRKYLPGGGPPSLTPAEQAEWARAMANFAACMRKSGVPGFPDPKLGTPPLSSSGINPGSPLVQKAFNACQSLEPTFGPRIQL